MGRRGVRSRGIAVPATVRAVFATAALPWQSQPNDSVCAGPLAASNGVVLVPTLGSVTALSELDGHQLWINTDNGASNGSPAFTGDGVYVGQGGQFNDASPVNGAT